MPISRHDRVFTEVAMLLTRLETSHANRGLLIERVRIQIVLGVVFAVIVPSIAIFVKDPVVMTNSVTALYGIKNSALAALFAVLLAVMIFRRVTSFPGIRAFRFVIPTYCGAYGVVLAAILALRVNYSGLMLLLSFILAVGVAFCSNFYVLRHGIRRFYLVPFGRYEVATRVKNAEWIVMDEPRIPEDPAAIIVADLRFDHEQEWEQMLAHAAVAGHPVYHIKQLRESLSGKVSIEHISENNFGSMLPNLAYRKVKRAVDLTSALALLPLLAIPLMIVALLIKLDSPGTVLFRQQRMGYRGKPFSIYKFRTMRPAPVGAVNDAREAARTGQDDPRVTRFGRFLRQSRIDELPQILNIIAGDMSWIGPRPEAVALSEWYEKEIPFYFYRHIVRPGITGWAQVNQGHVSDIDSVSTKLAYDFYYIKNFSAWLDVLISLRTISTMINGFGAR
jgi:lipopolysaccharide/colanic/teichoic acid biosynthesis glycosyltransferase